MVERIILYGKGISPGMAEGRIVVHEELVPIEHTCIPIDSQAVATELEHLRSSTAVITADLVVLAKRVEREMDSSTAAVFAAHQAILNDPLLGDELRHEIRNGLVSASSAVKTVFQRWELRFMQMETQISRDKATDIRDIAQRLSNALSGTQCNPFSNMPKGCVLVTKRMLPSDAMLLAERNVVAVLLEHGQSGSHAALFIRSMGLPCIARINDLVSQVKPNDVALVDAQQGTVIVSPNNNDSSTFHHKCISHREHFTQAITQACQPAVTRNGIAIAVQANVGCRADTELAVANGADGIGLYRTEQMYLASIDPPSSATLLQEMRSTLAPARGLPICVRLFDIGADKNFPFLPFVNETNPALGRRGIRMQLSLPGMLETQLRAILWLAGEFDIRILVPMVTLPSDLQEVRRCMTRLAPECGLTTLPQLGAMIETPAAALTLAALEPHVDFASFGTNDLAQYVFAVDRESASEERYYQDSHAAIIRLLHMGHTDAPHLPLSICGEVAGRVAHLPTLLACGFRSLSVVPPLIPIIKAAIRATSIPNERQSACGSPLPLAFA